MVEIYGAIIVFILGGIAGLIFDSGFSPFCWYALAAYFGIWICGSCVD